MRRLSGDADLAPQAKADLQQFVSMFDGAWAAGLPHDTWRARCGSRSGSKVAWQQRCLICNNPLQKHLYLPLSGHGRLLSHAMSCRQPCGAGGVDGWHRQRAGGHPLPV